LDSVSRAVSVARALRGVRVSREVLSYVVSSNDIHSVLRTVVEVGGDALLEMCGGDKMCVAAIAELCSALSGGEKGLGVAEYVYGVIEVMELRRAGIDEKLREMLLGLPIEERAKLLTTLLTSLPLHLSLATSQLLLVHRLGLSCEDLDRSREIAVRVADELVAEARKGERQGLGDSEVRS